MQKIFNKVGCEGDLDVESLLLFVVFLCWRLVASGEFSARCCHFLEIAGPNACTQPCDQFMERNLPS